MKPIIKYQGGKTKELPLIQQYFTKNRKRVVEPFCGGAAVSFAMEIPALINDINKDVINLYQVVADDNLYPSLQSSVDAMKSMDHDQLYEKFYDSRDIINRSIDDVDPLIRALSYITIRQLCFSGMERYNSKGEFNVPFGHYKRFACNLSQKHHDFLRLCDIRCGSAIDILSEVTEDDFVFIDPPYLDRLGYSTGDGGVQMHTKLADAVHNCMGEWLIIHCDDPFYQNEYSVYDITTADFNYSQRWGKNKNHSKSKVEHLYISNVPLLKLAQDAEQSPLSALYY